MRRPATIVTVALAGLVLAACGSTSSSGGSSPGSSTAPATIEGTSWTLVSYLAATTDTTKAVGSARLAFEPASRMSGSTGCNSFGGVWTQDGSSLTLTPGATTKKACPGPLATQETDVLTGLQRVASYAIAGTELTLAGSDGKVLFTYAKAAVGLPGTSWTATGINNGKGGVVSVPAGVTVTAEFGTDGLVSGSGGCNTYNGPYTTTGTDGIKLGPLGSTRIFCDGDKGTTEDLYFAALDKVTTYEIAGDELTLRDSAGAAQVTYQAG
jgi:heat shock protein HslJ